MPSGSHPGAIDVARNLGVTAQNKHFDRDIHYVREQCALQKIVMEYVNTHAQTADIFTKRLDKTKFLHHRSRLLH